MVSFHFMPSFLVSLPFPRFSPSWSLTIIMAVVFCCFSCVFLLALSFQDKEQFLPFLSVKAFGSSMLPPWFHTPYPAFARGYLLWPSCDLSAFTFYYISFHLGNSLTTCFKMLDFTPFCFYLNSEWIMH